MQGQGRLSLPPPSSKGEFFKASVAKVEEICARLRGKSRCHKTLVSVKRAHKSRRRRHVHAISLSLSKGFFLLPPILFFLLRFNSLCLGQLFCLPALHVLSIFARETRAAVRPYGNQQCSMQSKERMRRCGHMYPWLRFGEGIRLVELSGPDPDRTPRA